jgi:hypothetical protein
MDIYNARQNIDIVYGCLQCKNKYLYCLWIFTMQEQILILFMDIYNARKNINIVYGYLQCKKK